MSRRVHHKRNRDDEKTPCGFFSPCGDNMTCDKDNFCKKSDNKVCKVDSDCLQASYCDFIKHQLTGKGYCLPKKKSY